MIRAEMFPGARAPASTRPRSTCDPRFQIRRKTAAPRTAGCRAPEATSRPPNVNGSVWPNQDCHSFPGRFRGTEAHENVVPKHRGRQNQRERDDRLDQKFPAPPRERHPVGDGQARDEENRRNRYRQFERERDSLPVQGFTRAGNVNPYRSSSAEVAGVFT